MTVGEVEQLLRETNFNGFPVVTSADAMFLVGYVTRRDLKLAIGLLFTLLLIDRTLQRMPGAHKRAS